MKVIDSLGVPGAVWINPPDVLSFDKGRLTLITGPETDFWEQTYYGFQHHTGHACGFYAEGDFTLQVKVMADFTHLYDQAGIFILEDERHWMKAGIEFNDDQSAMGSVVTREMSDWSTGIFEGDPGVFWMRATLRNASLRIQYSVDGVRWPLLRLCHWPGDQKRFVGVMACTPQRQGLEVSFDEFSIGSPSEKALHDLS